MLLDQREYKLRDMLALCFRAAPAHTAAMLLLSVAAGLLPALAALASTAFIDTAMALHAGAAADIAPPIAFVVATVAGIWLSRQALQYSRRIIVLKSRAALRPDMTEKCARLEYAHIENPDTWDVISRVTKNPEKEIDAFTDAVAGALTLLLNILSVIGLLLSQVWWAALATLAFSVPLLLLALRGGRENYQANRDTEREERLQNYLSETLISREAAEERAMFRYTDHMTRRFADAFKRAFKMRFKVQAKWFFRMKLSSVLFSFIALLITLTLVYPTVNGEITVGMFMSLVVAAFSLVQNMSWGLSFYADTFAKATEYLKDLSKFMALSETAGALDAPDEPPARFESLEVRDVSFVYPGTEKKILDHLSLTVLAGQHIAFVGVNGAGKTTLTKLLTGLYDGYEGEILINGRELRTYSQAALKSLYSLVFQDFARYQVSMRDNIALEHRNREARIAGIADTLDLNETIDSLKDGLDNELGRLKEGGQELSGGQWQRVAIARALVNPAPIRILDEPTAALDPISEANLYSSFRSLSHGTTTLFISHRLGSTKLADRIDVIDGGHVRESGTHDELMALKGVYAEMFEAQRSWYQ